MPSEHLYLPICSLLAVYLCKMIKQSYQLQVGLLKWATFSVFAGRAWQHFFWDAPYRELLWDDRLMKPLIETVTPWTWEEYVTNLGVDKGIQYAMTGLGVFYAICAVLALAVEKWPTISRPILSLGAFSLAVLGLMYMKEYFLHVGQFFEYTLQFLTPVFLLMVAKQQGISPRTAFWMKIAIALTFTCHGLYAVGYYPRPGQFVHMTMQVLDISQENALTFLNLAGAMDFMLAIGIFLPRKWALVFLAYAVVWGFATSLARTWANFYWDFWLESLHQWLFETVYRLPHGLVPLGLFSWIWNRKQGGIGEEMGKP